MNSMNDQSTFNDQNDMTMSPKNKRRLSLTCFNSPRYINMGEHQHSNENQGYLTDSDTYSYRSCQHDEMQPFRSKYSRPNVKNCLADRENSLEYFNHFGNSEIRNLDTTDFSCSHMGDDSECLESSFTVKNGSIHSSQDVQLMDNASLDSPQELSVVQNQISHTPTTEDSTELIPAQLSEIANFLTESLFFPRNHDIQDVSLLENVYLSHSIDYQPSRTYERNTLVSHDGNTVANQSSIFSHRFCFPDDLSADDSFAHAISPVESSEESKDPSPVRVFNPRITNLLTMDTEDLDYALRDISEIDVTGLRRLNVSSFDKLIKVKRAREPNFIPLIIEAIAASPRKMATKAAIFEYIISNYELSIFMNKAHSLLCNALSTMLDNKKIVNKRGRGLRGLFEISEEQLKIMKQEEEEEKKRISEMNFYSSDYEENDMVRYDLE